MSGMTLRAATPAPALIDPPTARPTALPATNRTHAATDTASRDGTGGFRRTTIALFLAGLSTFAVLYCVQPLLPEFSGDFAVAPATASLALSASTLSLGIAMLIAGALSESWGRKPMMAASLLAASTLTLLAALTPGFSSLIAVRVLTGIALSGVPAVAMAYLSEEVAPNRLGLAMGLYISGNAVGGMSGRLITGIITDLTNWRVAVAAIGAIGLASAIAFCRLLPPSRHFRPEPLNARALVSSYVELFTDPGLRWLFAIGFLVMGGFVSLYNYIGYRLTAAPYELSQSLVGSIFIVYLLGSAASAWCGRLADRLGRRRVLWGTILVMLCGVGLTLGSSLWLILPGIALVTVGFFGAHSIASSWVGRRAQVHRGQAASTYLLFYYLGSSLVGTGSGLAWTHGGWPGMVLALSAILILALLVALRLRRLAPLPAAVA